MNSRTAYSQHAKYNLGVPRSALIEAISQIIDGSDSEDFEQNPGNIRFNVSQILDLVGFRVPFNGTRIGATDARPYGRIKVRKDLDRFVREGLLKKDREGNYSVIEEEFDRIRDEEL